MTITENAESTGLSTQDAERAERAAEQRSKEEDEFEEGMLEQARKFRKEQEGKPTSS